MATLDNLKIRLGITGETQDGLLSLTISDTESFFKAYCHRDDIPATAAGLVERLAALFYIRQQGGYNQGESSGDHSVTSYVLGDDIPNSFLKELAAYRKLVML